MEWTVIDSEVLGEKIVVLHEPEARIPAQEQTGLVAYAPREISLLEEVGDEGLQMSHLVKKMFNGRVVKCQDLNRKEKLRRRVGRRMGRKR
jgi:hypothetical protein